MNTMSTKERAIFESGMIEYMKDQIAGKASTSSTKGKQTAAKSKYIPKGKRVYTSNTDFSASISVHAKRDLTDSQRTVENSRLRETMKSGKVNIQIKPIDLNLFSSLFSGKDKKGIIALFGKASFFRDLKKDVKEILTAKGYNKKAVYSFPYRCKDTKEGNIDSLATRVRTALKAKHLHKEDLQETEIHKIR